MQNNVSENNGEELLPDTDAPTGSFGKEEYLTVDDPMPSASDYSAFSDEVFGFGYKKEKKGIIPSIGIYSNYFDGMNVFYNGDGGSSKIYLTFDEGYENGYTPKILDILKEKNVPAAFFITGDYLKRNGELVKRMKDEGHIIGNHTWNHPSMPKISDEESFRKELTNIDDLLYENLKIKTRYFRYPNGEFSEKSLAMIKDMGYTTVFWSVAYKDWERDVSRGAEHAYNSVISQIHNGAIILLHAVSKDNCEALPLMIDELRREKYEFVSLDELK